MKRSGTECAGTRPGLSCLSGSEILSLPPSLARDEVVASPAADNATLRAFELIAVGMTWEAEVNSEPRSTTLLWL